MLHYYRQSEIDPGINSSSKLLPPVSASVCAVFLCNFLDKTVISPLVT